MTQVINSFSISLSCELAKYDAFNGNIKKSPFNFQHFDLKKIALYRNDEMTPEDVLTLAL